MSHCFERTHTPTAQIHPSLRLKHSSLPLTFHLVHLKCLKVHWASLLVFQILGTCLLLISFYGFHLVQLALLSPQHSSTFDGHSYSYTTQGRDSLPLNWNVVVMDLSSNGIESFRFSADKEPLLVSVGHALWSLEIIPNIDVYCPYLQSSWKASLSSGPFPRLPSQALRRDVLISTISALHVLSSIAATLKATKLSGNNPASFCF